ncbi:formate dehydrogenase accessory sulfurtransferase FdhD [Motiliproteus sp. SC1-56]|uniref:formate dehydrogenase accessory sulfurtransferase FdhD n=1 Tax=Motiliproteus sp. SC1-56 TaxID=2799565 RepID=UPI001A8CCFE9|nr:formate dehydrogenase accessory sulfurtransferase FdhD [Motiliproteus sp. SC1-56]
MNAQPPRPLLSQAGLENIHRVEAFDEQGARQEVFIAGESPLTIYLDKREVVTLMTLGVRPELLTLGYLHNQGFIERIDQVRSIQVDWEVEAVAVVTENGVSGLDEKLAHRTVTTGCGQGTVFGGLMEKIEATTLTPQPVPQSQIYGLLENLRLENEVYKRAGGVHGCALCEGTRVLSFVEDVGRHNAVDTLAGEMLLEGWSGADKVFYTTGRLTSEMVIKVAQMGISTLISRSGVTRMGMAVASQVGITLIGRAKGRHFLVFNGHDQVRYDQVPAPMAKSQKQSQPQRA